MLFNEPEVLTAISVAIGNEDNAVVTIEEHEGKKKPGKKPYSLTSRAWK